MSGHWETLVESPHDCATDRPDPGTVGDGSMWVCDCGKRFVVNRWSNGDADYRTVLPDGVCSLCAERPSEDPPRWSFHINGRNHSACTECANRIDAEKRAQQAIDKENQ